MAKPPARRFATLAMGEPGVLEDVGVSPGDADDSLAVAADQQRYVVLHRADAEVVDGELMMCAVHRTAPVSSSERSAFTDSSNRETCDRRLAQLHADRVVLRLRVTGTQPQHHTATGEPIERCRSPCEHRRMMELVVEHQWPDPQSRGGVGGDHQGNEWIDGPDVVVREQFVVAEGLDLAGQRDRARRDRRDCVLGSRSGMVGRLTMAPP